MPPEFTDSIRSTCGLTASCTISGGRWTSTEWCSTSWCRSGGMPRPPNAFQAASGQVIVQTTETHHRRPAQLRRGPARDPTGCPAPNQPLRHQPRREVSQTYPAPRTTDATVQVTRAGTDVPVIPRHELWPLPSAATPDVSKPVPARPGQGLSDLAAEDLRPDRSVSCPKVCHAGIARPLFRQPDNALSRLLLLCC
jgi:hypothetical protein